MSVSVSIMCDHNISDSLICDDVVFHLCVAMLVIH